MKILLLHPVDSAEKGPWRAIRWDWIVDLGWAGRCVYEELAQRLGCRVVSISEIADHWQHQSRVRDLWRSGCGQLLDAEGIDWWDVFFPLPYANVERILLLSELTKQIPRDAEVAATRPHFLVRGLSALLDREVKTFVAESSSGNGNPMARYYKAATTFRPSQLAEIAMDKWDGDYRLRRYINIRPRKSVEPVTLLPSGYINVSRAQVAYARILRHRKFLLVTTRRSGSLVNVPKNVELRSLASYALIPFSSSTESEYRRLVERWHHIRGAIFETGPVQSVAAKLGVFDELPSFLQKGLRIRDAWQNLLARENVNAVLSADENNPFTRLPVLLARSKNISTLLCDHGALNMTLAVRPLVSASYLVQGEMAQDYLLQRCGIQRDRIFVGAPATPKPVRSQETQRDRIVFFSEAYELTEGRTESFYRELLPKLCSLATQTRRKLIIKLHPFESMQTRTRLVGKLLTREQQRAVEVREGKLTPDLFERAWFSLTVESSVAVECALKNVPCFLCNWFDASWWEYGAQYAKFAAGYLLNSPEEILGIPKRLQGFQVTPGSQQRLIQQTTSEGFDAILSGTLPGAAVSHN